MISATEALKYQAERSAARSPFASSRSEPTKKATS